MKKSIVGACNLYPDCAWLPTYLDGKMFACPSCDGWELNTPEFRTVDRVVSALLGKILDWPETEDADAIIARIEKEDE